MAVEIPPLPELKKFHTEVPLARGGQAVAIVAVPEGGQYAALGQRIAAAVEGVSGARPAVKSASELTPQMVHDAPAILLGHFANNPMVARIYDEFLITLDARYPGVGGYVIRTVHDPVGAGVSFVYLGGADVASVGKAVEDFLTTLPEAGDIVYPHTVKVIGPTGALMYKPGSDRVAERIEAARGKNFRAVAAMLTEAGVAYYRTGAPAELEVFKGVAPIFLEVFRKLGEIGDMRGALDLVNAWDAIEEAPQFSAEDRARITELMWEFTHRFTHPRKRGADPGPTPAGNDWDARATSDLARYWHKYYGLDPNHVRTWANERFLKQSGFWRSKEDCPGYGGMTMYDVLYYVLPFQHEQYWTGGTGRKMADYGMAVMNNLGGIAGFGDTGSMGGIGYWADVFRVVGWKLRDGRYLYAERHSSGAGRGSSHFFHNNYFQNEIAPEKPDDLMGVHVVPLPDWVYEHRRSVLGTAPSEMNPVLDADPVPPRDECFDKITFRTSMDPQDQYLILGGISHGYHAHPDGNAIIEMTDQGRYCLFDSGYFIPDTIEHNTLAIFRDGLFEPVPRLTGLAEKGDFGRFGMTQTYLNHYNGADWRRNIIWRQKEYFLVIDEVEARTPGNYGVLAVFRTLADERPEVGADRIRATKGGQPFNIVNASHTAVKLAGTLPPTPERHAVIESKSAELQPGQKMYFRNLLYTGTGQDDWRWEIVPAGENGVFIKGPDGYAAAAVGKAEPAPDMLVEAAISHVGEDGFALTAGKTLTAGLTWFASDVPVNIEVTLGPRATGAIETEKEAVVRLPVAGDVVTLNGKAVNVRVESGGSAFAVPPGRHTLEFEPKAQRIPADWAGLYAAAQKAHEAALAALGTGADGGPELRASWTVENATTRTEAVYVNEKGESLRELAAMGRAKCWTEAQRGIAASRATDGDLETYAAVSSGIAWSGDLPKDIGIEWHAPVAVGCLRVVFYDENYAPTMDGQQLQAWGGKDWQPVAAEISKEHIGTSSYGDPLERWTYAFEPVTTTRIRVFITEFVQSRTAVRELQAFAAPARPEEREVRVPHRTHGLAVMDLDGDGADEIVAVAGPSVKCIKSGGAVVWEKTLEAEALSVAAYDLDNDGRGEVVVGAANHCLYCYDHAGNERWTVETPADPFTPDREPMRGAVEVVACADIDGDGDGEIVLGSGNWFAYAYDHLGNLLWTALNWAHHPTSIAFADLDQGKKAALIGTTYCAANLFGPDGGNLDSVSVGYHGAAMSAAAGDMDGDGVQELIVGSRVGGLHLKQHGGARAWAKFMGAEVTQVALADLNGDGRLELVAGSKNFYVLAADASGKILWNANVGESVLDLKVADVNGDGAPEVVAATEGGMVRVLSNAGELLATMRAPANVTKVAVADLAGDGSLQIVAGADDGRLYGRLKQERR